MVSSRKLTSSSTSAGQQRAFFAIAEAAASARVERGGKGEDRGEVRGMEPESSSHDETATKREGASSLEQQPDRVRCLLSAGVVDVAGSQSLPQEQQLKVLNPTSRVHISLMATAHARMGLRRQLSDSSISVQFRSSNMMSGLRSPERHRPRLPRSGSARAKSGSDIRTAVRGVFNVPGGTGGRPAIHPLDTSDVSVASNEEDTPMVRKVVTAPRGTGGRPVIRPMDSSDCVLVSNEEKMPTVREMITAPRQTVERSRIDPMDSTEFSPVPHGEETCMTVSNLGTAS